MNAKNANGSRCDYCYSELTPYRGAPDKFQYRYMLSTITSSMDGSHGDCRPFPITFSHNQANISSYREVIAGIFGRSYVQLSYNSD